MEKRPNANSRSCPRVWRIHPKKPMGTKNRWVSGVGVLDSAGRNNAVLSQFISYFSRGWMRGSGVGHARYLIFVLFLRNNRLRQYSKRRESDLRRVSRQSASPGAGSSPRLVREKERRREREERFEDNNDLSSRDIMLIRNLQFFLRHPTHLGNHHRYTSPLKTNVSWPGPRVGRMGGIHWISY